MQQQQEQYNMTRNTLFSTAAISSRIITNQNSQQCHNNADDDDGDNGIAVWTVDDYDNDNENENDSDNDRCMVVAAQFQSHRPQQLEQEEEEEEGDMNDDEWTTLIETTWKPLLTRYGTLWRCCRNHPATTTAATATASRNRCNNEHDNNINDDKNHSWDTVRSPLRSTLGENNNGDHDNVNGGNNNDDDGIDKELIDNVNDDDDNNNNNGNDDDDNVNNCNDGCDCCLAWGRGDGGGMRRRSKKRMSSSFVPAVWLMEPPTSSSSRPIRTNDGPSLDFLASDDDANLHVEEDSGDNDGDCDPDSNIDGDDQSSLSSVDPIVNDPGGDQLDDDMNDQRLRQEAFDCQDKYDSALEDDVAAHYALLRITDHSYADDHAHVPTEGYHQNDHEEGGERQADDRDGINCDEIFYREQYVEDRQVGNNDEDEDDDTECDDDSSGATVIRFDHVSFELSPRAVEDRFQGVRKSLLHSTAVVQFDSPRQTQLQKSADSAQAQDDSKEYHDDRILELNEAYTSDASSESREARSDRPNRKDNIPSAAQNSASSRARRNCNTKAGDFSSNAQQSPCLSQPSSSASSEAEWDWDREEKSNSSVSIAKGSRKAVTTISIVDSEEEDEYFTEDDDDDDEIDSIKYHKKTIYSKGLTAIAFRKAREQLAKEIFAEFDEQVFNGKLVDTTVVEWSKKLRSTAGLTRLKKLQQGGSSSSQRTAAIELSTKVIDDLYRLRSTLLHEMCHAAAWVIDDVAKPPHGACFKKWARLGMGQIRDVTVTTTHDYHIEYKYAWACTGVDCDIVYQRHCRRSIDVEKHRCGRCKSRLMEVTAAAATTTTSFAKQGRSSNDLVKTTKEGWVPRQKAPPSAYNLFVKQHSASIRQELLLLLQKQQQEQQPLVVTQASVMKECAKRWREQQQQQRTRVTSVEKTGDTSIA